MRLRRRIESSAAQWPGSGGCAVSFYNLCTRDDHSWESEANNDRSPAATVHVLVSVSGPGQFPSQVQRESQFSQGLCKKPIARIFLTHGQTVGKSRLCPTQL